VAIGSQALQNNTTGNTNTAIGRQALYHTSVGTNNIALGAYAGMNVVEGSSNIEIGNVGANESNTIRIGGSVRYEAVNAMLLNEFLKEHRKVQDLEANDAAQQQEIKALAATVKEQAAQIQKVSAQLELQKLRAQTVANNAK
jgi:hypothetical protein